jgi:predicted phosphoadenosine phosphosulfate sulfurtransferase
MKYYLKQSVYDAALERINWVFDEFPIVIAGVSGGKDSTVIFHLALQVARERGRLPLKVMFLDQEAEWGSTVEQIKEWMYHPDVEPLWYQIPIRLFNATSVSEHWLHCWDEAAKDRWIHPKDPIAIKENVYGTDRFAEMFTAILKHDYPKSMCAYLSGVRAEETPSRYMAVTQDLTYKDVTWGKTLDKKIGHYTFYPIYDWSYTDVWKAIHDNKWSYNKIYDKQFQYGLPVCEMRVSNLHHETAVHSLFSLQEMEGDTYGRLTQRLCGVDMAAKMGDDDFFVSTLPFMFKDWREYRDYLLDKLITNEEWKKGFKKKFEWMENIWTDSLGDKLFKAHINSILTNDWEFIKLNNLEKRPANAKVRQKKQYLERHDENGNLRKV